VEEAITAMRIPLIHRERLDPELQAMLTRWEADGGDPNFILTFGRLPERLKRFVEEPYPASERLRRVTAARSEGNPFFVEELVRAFKERGDLVLGAGYTIFRKERSASCLRA
jgi:hypothetical protein